MQSTKLKMQPPNSNKILIESDPLTEAFITNNVCSKSTSIKAIPTGSKTTEKFCFVRYPHTVNYNWYFLTQNSNAFFTETGQFCAN